MMPGAGGARRGRPVSARAFARWTLTLAALGLVTAAMYAVRTSLDKAHVALVYVLVVLAASAVGGRALGLTVAGLAFLCFDVLFLAPFLTLTIQNPLDWLVLVTFLITSVVAAQLLYRANATAEEATQRAIEVDRLAALGAETLNAADADEALRAIAGVIRNSVDADECDIFLHAMDGRITRVASARRGSDDAATRGGDVRSGSLAEWILERGSSAVELADGTVRVAHDVPLLDEPAGGQRSASQRETTAAVRALMHDQQRGSFGRLRQLAEERRDDSGSGRPPVRALALPLLVRDHTVGVLRLAARDELSLSPEQARLLIALAYYAALGVERARLVAAAERAEAERRLESLRSALLTAVSHDLRTPLTTIKGIASEIRRQRGVERAAVIEQEADRMDALVSDLLDLSRIHAGAVRPAIAVNTIDDLLGASLRAAAGVLEGHDVLVDVPGDKLLAGRFDLSQTVRIVTNLLDNAAKYSPPGSPIDVRVREAAGQLTIDVMDRGPGVAERERDRIFAPFYRQPGVPPDVRGHGLGLSIAKGLAEAQGCTVRYAPRADGGSVFSFDLPAVDTDALAAEPPAARH
jgi:two-component system sensor histidine kinase KdpD